MGTVERGGQPQTGEGPTVGRRERLRLPREVPFVVVSGAFGSGKTTLLRQWFAELGADDRTTPVWLERPGDSDLPDQFSFQLAAALDGEQPVAVFIDDFDLASAESQQAALDAVLAADARGVNSSGQLVVALTSAPSFPLGPLRVSNLIAEIDDEQLRFTEAETAELARFSGVEVSSLLSLTDGWASGAAAVLDYLATEQPRSSATRIDSLSDEMVADVARQLVDEVESRFDQPTVEFLTRSSIADELTQRLAAALTDDRVRADPGRLLRDGVPVTWVDRERNAYRLPVVLRHGLHRRLMELASPAALASSHVRAAERYHQSGQFRRAIEHLLAAGDGARAADVLAELWSLGRAGVTLDDLRGFDEADLERYVPHVLTVALVRGDHGDVNEVERALEILRAERWEGSLPHGFGDLEEAIVELELFLPPHDLHTGQRVVDAFSRPTVEGAERSIASRYAAAHWSYNLGRFDEARRIAEEILVGHLSIGRHNQRDGSVTVLAVGLLALIDHDHGHVDDARRQHARSVELEGRFGLVEFFGPAKHVRSLTRAIITDDPSDVRAALLADVVAAAENVSLQTHAGLELIRLMDRERRHDSAVEILDRVQLVAQGVDLPHMLAQRLAAVKRSFQVDGDPRLPSRITPSERFVLHLLADPDLSQVDIGQTLDLSINTVKSHLRSIYQKLGAPNRGYALDRAADLGLLATVLPWEASGSSPD